MKNLFLFIALITASFIKADTLTYTASIGFAPTDWTNHVSLPKFDPANGTLTGAVVVIISTNTTQTKVENLNRAPATAVSTITTTLAITGAPLVTTNIVTVASRTNVLANDDGVLDFGGPSGFTNPKQVLVKSQDQTVTDLSAVTGTGSFALTVNAAATSSLTGMSAYSVSFQTSHAAAVSITYTYTCGP